MARSGVTYDLLVWSHREIDHHSTFAMALDATRLNFKQSHTINTASSGLGDGDHFK